MIYHFSCNDCEITVEINRSMDKGPGKKRCPECKKTMCQEFGGNFILKGEGFPGKDLNKRKYKAAEAREKNDQEYIDQGREQKVVDEVMNVRRKGKKAKEELQKDKPQKWKEYIDASKKGVRAKKKK